MPEGREHKTLLVAKCYRDSLHYSPPNFALGMQEKSGMCEIRGTLLSDQWAGGEVTPQLVPRVTANGS